MSKVVPDSSGGMVILNPPSSKQISPSIHWCFTFNNYNSSDIYIFQNINCKKIIFQEEIGEKGTKHLQGYIDFGKKVRPLSIIPNKNVHWEKCRNIEASIDYCMKSETKAGICFQKGFPKPLSILSMKLCEWQEGLYNTLINTEPDNRTIHWYWSEKGKTGKTSFCKYCVAKHKDWAYVCGNSMNVKHAISKQYEKDSSYPRVIFYDVPRNKPSIDYSALEQVKNGLFFSGKYDSTTVIGECPYLIVFANIPPDTEGLSLDRWKIINID